MREKIWNSAASSRSREPCRPPFVALRCPPPLLKLPPGPPSARALSSVSPSLSSVFTNPFKHVYPISLCLERERERERERRGGRKKQKESGSRAPTSASLLPPLFLAPHLPRSASAASRISSLPMTSLRISEVPAPISYSLASRRIRPVEYSFGFVSFQRERERRSVRLICLMP